MYHRPSPSLFHVREQVARQSRKVTGMRVTYRVLAYAVAVLVMVQAAAIAWAVAGFTHWIADGGVADKGLMESEESPFSEALGFMVHGMNGMMVIPVVGLLLLIVSFLAKVPGGIKWAGITVGLIVVQVLLGMFLHDTPSLGFLHGLNALLLFGAAVVTGRRAGAGRAVLPRDQAPEHAAA